VLVVDTGSPADIDPAALPVQASYIHAESPPAQIRSQLRTVAAATTAPPASVPPTPADVAGIELPIPVVVSAVDTQTVVAVNSAAASLFDQPRSALVGCSPTELRVESATDTDETLLDAAVETGQIQRPATGDGEAVTIAAGDGSSLPVDYNAVTTTINGREHLIETFEDATDPARPGDGPSATGRGDGYRPDRHLDSLAVVGVHLHERGPRRDLRPRAGRPPRRDVAGDLRRRPTGIYRIGGAASRRPARGTANSPVSGPMAHPSNSMFR